MNFGLCIVEGVLTRSNMWTFQYLSAMKDNHLAIVFTPGCVYICILILEILSLQRKSSEGVAAGSTCKSLCLPSVHG